MSDIQNTNNKHINEDFLDEDPEIPSQRYVLLSFISPENVLSKKEHFFFEKFLEDYEIQTRTKSFEKYVAGFVQKVNDEITVKSDALEAAGDIDTADILRKNRLRIDDLLGDYNEYIRKNQREITQTTIVEQYKDFLSRKQTELEDKFLSLNDFHTTVRGVKIRGTYATTAEAASRAKKLQRSDQYHNILVGEVGKWLPWDPASSQIDKQEYAEEQLNELMKKYKENEDARDEFYKNQKRERPSKQVFGADDNITVSDSAPKNELHSMFSDSGDLVLKRKMEAAAFFASSESTNN
jgi:hypothetical protein